MVGEKSPLQDISSSLELTNVQLHRIWSGLEYPEISIVLSRNIEENTFNFQKLTIFRVVEQHKDGYPHIHAILQFDAACIMVSNNRYFDNLLYKKWRALWKHGHSDYQKPRNAGSRTLLYTLKYLIKNTTKRTIYKKILPISDEGKSATPDKTEYAGSNSDPTSDYTSEPKDPATTIPVRLHGVKLATWSRDFDFTPFLIIKNKEPCPIDTLLHKDSA